MVWESSRRRINWQCLGKLVLTEDVDVVDGQLLRRASIPHTSKSLFLQRTFGDVQPSSPQRWSLTCE